MIHEIIPLYPQRQDVTLTAYVQNDSAEMLCGNLRPAVLICPGGAYLSCSDREAEPVAMRFAAMGYHAFVLRYSVYFQGGPSQLDQKNLPAKPHCVTPNPMLDIGAAFLKIHEIAEKWLVDTDKIAICGFSAGAHNCGMYANHWSKPVMTEHFNRDADCFRPAACILGYGIFDYTLMRTPNPDDPFSEVLMNAASIAYFGTDAPTKEQLLAASPALSVDGDTPPTFLWTTSEDSLVPAQNTALQAAALAKNKIPFECHIFESGPHGLALATQASASSLFETDNDAKNWVELAENWLKKRLSLPLRQRPVWMP